MAACAKQAVLKALSISVKEVLLEAFASFFRVSMS